ncbi:Mitochondrial distribution and morphology protein 12 [Gaertneriomyces sp. JEL0708]|nr:Mitochondrial distribution and morphology protein 12 [Gaertneriomyces sp. JEL0708]
MSFLINWELLSDGVEADRLREFLNARFQEIERPAFLGPLSVTELDFGDIPPEIAIVDICDPAPEFYLPDDDASETWEREESIGALESELGDGTSDVMSSLSSAYRPSSVGVIPSEISTSGLLRRHPYVANPQSSYDVPLEPFTPDRVYSTPARIVTSSTIRPPFIYGSDWSGSVGLRLGLGLGSPGYHHAVSTPEPLRAYSHHPRRQSTTSTSSQPLMSPTTLGLVTPGTPGSDFSAFADFTPDIQLSDEEIAMQYASNMRRESDAQVEVEVIYKGNMRLAISTELIVNQPTPAFMVLPLTLTLTGFHFTATAIIAYLGDHMNFCFKEPNAGSAILHDLSIDSEVGDKHKQVLKNVGRIEKFIVEQLRKVIQDYLVLPNYQSLSLIHEGDLDADDSYDHSEHFIGESAFSDRNA